MNRVQKRGDSEGPPLLHRLVERPRSGPAAGPYFRQELTISGEQEKETGGGLCTYLIYYPEKLRYGANICNFLSKLYSISLFRKNFLQKAASVALFHVGNLLRRSGSDHLSAPESSFRPDIDNPVSRFRDIQIVLNDNNGRIGRDRSELQQ